jgi:hypothetical protein
VSRWRVLRPDHERASALPCQAGRLAPTERRIVPDLEIACGERSCRNNLLNLFCSWRYRAGIPALFPLFPVAKYTQQVIGADSVVLRSSSVEMKLAPNPLGTYPGNAFMFFFLLLGGPAVGVRMSTSPIGSISSGETVGHESRNHPFFLLFGDASLSSRVVVVRRGALSGQTLSKSLFLLLVPHLGHLIPSSSHPNSNISSCCIWPGIVAVLGQCLFLDEEAMESLDEKARRDVIGQVAADVGRALPFCCLIEVPGPVVAVPSLTRLFISFLCLSFWELDLWKRKRKRKRGIFLGTGHLRSISVGIWFLGTVTLLLSFDRRKTKGKKRKKRKGKQRNSRRKKGKNVKS